MKPPPTETLVIQSNGSTVKVLGKVSQTGWMVSREEGKELMPVGTRKYKHKAVRLARDCCEPGVTATFIVHPHV